jgi:hypothetical protein
MNLRETTSWRSTVRKHSLKYFFVPITKRLVPGEEHPQNIRERSICGEMLRAGLGITLIPSSHFPLEDVSNAASSGLPWPADVVKTAWLESA